ncbi:MAG: FHA domain-containing protein [Gemmatimonadaceae bacterium]
MALILEIRDPRGHTIRQRLDGHPVVLGRGLSNDVILDDAYVDARHARLERDEAGAWSIVDLGTVNGLYANGERAVAATSVGAGSEIRLGRTLLRFRDSDELVPPALVDDEAPATAPVEPSIAPSGPPAPNRVPRRGARLVAALLETTRGQLAVVGAMLAAVAINSWLGDTSRSPGSSVLGIVLMVGTLLSVWALIWAAVTRRADRRFHYLGHLAVVSAALLAAIVAVEVNEWLTFFFPGADVIAVLYVAGFLVLAAAIVAAHLGVSGTVPRRRRWRIGFMVAGAILALTVFAVLVKDETFSDVPRFASGLKPLSGAVIPARSVDDFSAVMQKAKRKADEAAKKQVDP